MTEHRPYAQACAERRERHRRVGCTGGQHYMRRAPDGPADRPWRCVDCGATRAWSGGFEAWLVGHAPLIAAAAAGAAP